MIMLYLNLLRFRNSKKNSINKYRILHIIFSMCIILKKNLLYHFFIEFKLRKIIKNYMN